ncbi:MAG: Peptidase M16 domain protein [Candidatus Amesbacteria bacterium GW2011_GWA2_47_70]|nr:MAG: Peptidase M16 domain protein [Candidatus Amesbacteria bacterium GW2011_GWA2_47_70]
MVLVPMSGVQSVAVGVYIGTGSRYEDTKNNGISHFLEHMVFKGTKKFPTHKDTSYLEGLGAIQNAWTDVDATAYWCKLPSNRWRQGLEMVKELALYPTIPNKDLQIERGVILEEIQRRNDRPDELAGEALQKLMFPDNALGWMTLGQPEVIKSLSRADFLRYHQSQYKSDNIVVAVAGEIRNWKLEIRDLIEDWFGGLAKEKAGLCQPFIDKQNAAAFKVQNKKLANQAHVELGVRGVNVTDPRRFALTLLTSYLGQGLSSRLFMELREKRGLCYAVHASESRWQDTGEWDVYAGVNIDKLEGAVEGILNELRRIKQIKLNKKELEAVKEKVRGPILYSMENPVRQMNWYARQALDRPEEVMDYDTVIDRLMGVTAEEVRQVAQDLFRTEKLNLAVVGPVEKKKEEKLLRLLRV